MNAAGGADARLDVLFGRLAGRMVCVNGLGISGPPVARALADRGARVTAVDGRDDEGNRRIAKELEDLDITVTLSQEPGINGPPGPKYWHSSDAGTLRTAPVPAKKQAWH